MLPEPIAVASVGPEYEIELMISKPAYGGGGEQYSTSEFAVVYATHESSITPLDIEKAELSPDARYLNSTLSFIIEAAF